MEVVPIDGVEFNLKNDKLELSIVCRTKTIFEIDIIERPFNYGLCYISASGVFYSIPLDIFLLNTYY